MITIVVAATSGLFSWPAASQLYQPCARILLAISVLLILALSTLGCVKNYKLTTSCASDSRTIRTSVWLRRAGLTAILCLAGFAAVHIYLISRLTQANGVPAYWRSVNLLSGVSPLLPSYYSSAAGTSGFGALYVDLLTSATTGRSCLSWTICQSWMMEGH
jgi:hypothetical protein